LFLRRIGAIFVMLSRCAGLSATAWLSCHSWPVFVLWQRTTAGDALFNDVMVFHGLSS